METHPIILSSPSWLPPSCMVWDSPVKGSFFWMNEWMNERKNERMKEWKKERKKLSLLNNVHFIDMFSFLIWIRLKLVAQTPKYQIRHIFNLNMNLRKGGYKGRSYSIKETCRQPPPQFSLASAHFFSPLHYLYPACCGSTQQFKDNWSNHVGLSVNFTLPAGVPNTAPSRWLNLEK